VSAAPATREVPAPHGGAGHPVDVAERGRTRIADRVVEKIAARAVAEVDRATGVPRQVLGVRLGSAGPDSRVRVNAEVDGTVVIVRVSMAVQWPAPVRTVTRQVRGHVTERLQTLTGLRVGQVDIDVPTLLTATADEGRRVT
jgi:uncharacterized alkaline shock family protein YloU